VRKETGQNVRSQASMNPWHGRCHQWWTNTTPRPMHKSYCGQQWPTRGNCWSMITLKKIRVLWKCKNCTDFLHHYSDYDKVRIKHAMREGKFFCVCVSVYSSLFNSNFCGIVKGLPRSHPNVLKISGVQYKKVCNFAYAFNFFQMSNLKTCLNSYM